MVRQRQGLGGGWGQYVVVDGVLTGFKRWRQKGEKGTHLVVARAETAWGGVVMAALHTWTR